jgi:hypothetical protein
MQALSDFINRGNGLERNGRQASQPAVSRIYKDAYGFQCRHTKQRL